MNTHLAPVQTRCVLAAAVAACTLFAGNVVAADRTVTVALRVDAHGLDLNQPAGARELYQRLENAAYVACTRANRVGLAPSTDPTGCQAKALAEAVRTTKVPMLTQAYLANHTLREAAARGIELPAQMAAK
jgi:UrcA family protein